MYALQCAADPDYTTRPRRTIQEALEDLPALASDYCRAPHLLVEVSPNAGRISVLLRVDVLAVAILTDPASPAADALRREQLRLAVSDMVTRQLSAEE